MGLAIAGIVAGVAGAATTAIGTLSAGAAQQKSLNYQAQVARNNQTIAYQNAETATQTGQQAATNKSMEARQKEAATTAAIASAGVDVNSGSASDVRTTQREVGELDTETVAHNAALQAYGYRTQATNFGAEAELQSAEASQAVPASELTAAGGLASSASSLGLQWAKLQQTGAT
jgi:hypothetical protein